MRFEISKAISDRAAARAVRAAAFSTKNGRPRIIDRRQQILPARPPKKSQISRAASVFRPSRFCKSKNVSLRSSANAMISPSRITSSENSRACSAISGNCPVIRLRSRENISARARLACSCARMPSNLSSTYIVAGVVGAGPRSPRYSCSSPSASGFSVLPLRQQQLHRRTVSRSLRRLVQDWRACI